MKINKAIQVMACAALLAVAIPAVPANAQMTAAQKQAVGEKLHAAVEKLNLTPDQKTKLQPMFADAKTKAAGVKADTTLTPDQKKAKIKDIGTELRNNVNSVLTPEQQATLKAELHEAKAKAAATKM
jgi:Spy/CpxP family protein refolding chaperone